MFRSISGRDPVYFRQDCLHFASDFYVTVGSILHHVTLNDRAIVWGSGIIDRKCNFARPKQVCALRGPLSAQRMDELGYETPQVFGDPAILLPDFLAPSSDKRVKVGLIPHYVDFELFAERFRNDRSVAVIDVCQEVDKVVRDITACETTLSTSLHGLIVSHAYGIESAWIDSHIGLTGDNVKFLDYFASIGVAPQNAWSLQLTESADELVRIARDAPGGDGQLRLCSPLRDACPFIGPHSPAEYRPKNIKT